MDFTFKIITYGCKVNQYESQSIREYWQSLGGCEVFEDDMYIATHEIENKINQENIQKSRIVADIILLSGCAVTAQGVSDARQMVRKLLRESPTSKVIVTGCAASAEPHDFAFDNVLACISQCAKWNLLHYHPLHFKTKQMTSPWTVPFVEKDKEYPDFSIKDFERSRPVLKIQDGCSHGCSYCIVPLTRGKARSRKPEDSLAEFSRLVEKGFREIVISGINLRQYGAEKENFWGFLRRLHKHVKEKYHMSGKSIFLQTQDGILSEKRILLKQNKSLFPRLRIRLSSLEPSQINQEGLETLEKLSEDAFLCPHLHLSLQSGSPTILKRMGREHYAPETIITIMEKLKSFWPTFALGADFLMGFVGETEEELQETLNLVEKLPLTYAHVFPYSIRPKTKAANLKGHLEKKVRQEHARQVREVVDIKKKNFMKFLLNQESMYVSLDCLHGKALMEKNIKLVGWNEFYVSCQVNVEKVQTNFSNKENKIDLIRELATSHELLKVRPIKIEGDKLVTSLI